MLKFQTMIDIHVDFLQRFINFFMKKFLLGGHSQRPYLHELRNKYLLVVVLKMRIFKTKKLAEELQKSVIRKFKKRKV